MTASQSPEFSVRALGSLEQKPGCPDYAAAHLGAERLRRLCLGECDNPGDQRRAITRIEIVRIRPQRHADEDVGPLIEDPWRRFECPDDPGGCSVEFDDPEFAASGRDALYYARALEAPRPAINGANLQTTFDAEGNATAIEPCRDADGCPAPVSERAWSSPIFVDRL